MFQHNQINLIKVVSGDSGMDWSAQPDTYLEILDTFSNFSRSNDNENKREYLDNKISDRELMAQRGSNPFSMQTSYVNDVVTRDMFLKPINTTQGRTKNQNKTDEE